MSWGAAAEGTNTAASSAGSSVASEAGSGVASNAGGYSIDAAPATQQAPSTMDSAMNGLEKFQKGSSQSLPEAYRNWGNNPGTYGYVAGKVQGMGGGGGGQPGAVTTNVNYQQPDNDYLRKRRGY